MNNHFINPIYAGQDPFACKGPDGYYYSVAEAPDSQSIEVFRSKRITDRGERQIAFRAFDSGVCSADLWAPEIWYLKGKWYIYFAGSSAPGMAHWDTHRMYVLEADEPMGPYRFAGELELGNHMSIDGTVMELPDGRLIFIYMRKYLDKNCLFMAPMSSPVKISAEPVMLTAPELPWEEDITEGPFPIVRKGKVMLMYAANAAHLPQYCLALMHCTDPDRILDPQVWTKEPQPILVGTEDVIGPGHACIVPSPDDSEDYLLFHSKFDHDYTLPGGWNRIINLLRVRWDEEERPVFDPLPKRGEPRPLPAGEMPLQTGGKAEIWPGRDGAKLTEYSYYRAKTLYYEADGLLIRGSACPDYGDKVLIRERQWQDFQLLCKMEAHRGESGILFRVQLPAVGACQWQGLGLYFRQQQWRLVCSNGSFLTVLQNGQYSGGKTDIRIRVRGNHVQAWVQDDLLLDTIVPDMPTVGRIGFGTQGGDGWLRYLSVEEIFSENSDCI